MHESQLDRYSLTVVHRATVVADLGEGLGPRPPYFGLKKKKFEIKEGPEGQSKQPPPP